jgi:pyruvate/2-oxoglutarate dehydrogenase complex dihydrolipoamide dehydrogenase (E3) component
VSSVVTARVDESLRPVPGSEREVPCDTLLLSVGLIPENELSKRAGVLLSPHTGGAVVDETLMTGVPGVFSCGNVLHIHDVADWASFEGFEAGRRAAEYIHGKRSADETVDVRAGENIRYVLPQTVRWGASGVTLNFRVRRPMRSVVVEVRATASGKSVASVKMSRLVPSEMRKIRITHPVRDALEIVVHD